MCRYLTLREEIEPTATAPVRRHLSQLDHLIRGNLEWSVRVPRHHDGRAVEPVMSPRARTPSDGRSSAPPIPAVASWWTER
ncbi:hypothetical protein ACN6LA_001995 [Streptomyces sp. SAS_269]|uniref:hypothetical protein n=1 Tax=Streptomyces sp. SAS_269 TaxID=3412749 RepID=UPI00403C84DE